MSSPVSNDGGSKSLDSMTQEEKIQCAIRSIQASNWAMSVRSAAQSYGVPRSTLQNRINGVKPRAEAHAHEQNLSPAQEDILVSWVKAQGRRGVPLTQAAIVSCAEDIAQKSMGVSWIHRFRSRHPDLTLKFTSSLEEARARSLTPAAVNGFYDLLQETVTEFNIPPENIYNMDEKGIQMGVGDRTAVLVDRNQKTVSSIEPGNRDLVTIIETVCADGTALRPSVIYEGSRRDPRWGAENPADASILISPNGWTDQELGYLWLTKDFDPTTAARNRSNGYRLLILDGHNSHCTYHFCKVAHSRRIIIICLPAHTTHALQPCDVGVFGPLAKSWKAHVTSLSRDYTVIDKYNLLKHYALARSKAFKSTTISSAFAKTGIYPFNRNAIDAALYEPAKNYTTQSAMPVPAEVPSLLVPIRPFESSVPSSRSSTPEYRIAHSQAQRPFTRRTVSYEYLQTQNELMQTQLDAAGALLGANLAQMRLMEAENARLRNKLFAKKPKKRIAVNTGTSRHLTSEENMHELLKHEFKQCLIQLKPKFRKIQKEIREAEKMQENAKKAEAARQKKAEKEAAKKAKAAGQRALGRGRASRASRGRARGSRGRGEGQRRARDDHAHSHSDSPNESSSSQHTQSISSASETGSVPPSPTLDPPPLPPRPRPRPRPLVQTNPRSRSTDISSNQLTASETDSRISGVIAQPPESLKESNHIEDADKLRVHWEDNDTTWVSLSEVEECAALDVYLL